MYLIARAKDDQEDEGPLDRFFSFISHNFFLTDEQKTYILSIS